MRLNPELARRVTGLTREYPDASTSLTGRYWPDGRIVRGKECTPNRPRLLGVRAFQSTLVARQVLSFGRGELIGLIDSGLFHFDWKSTPLWHWMRCYEPASTSLLMKLSMVGTTAQRSGALIPRSLEAM